MRGRSGLWLGMVAACALSAGGCRPAAPWAPAPGAKPVVIVNDGLSAAAREFVKGYERTAAGSAERAAWLARHACPCAGPRPALLLDEAVTDAARLGQAVFLGCDRVETGFDPSTALAAVLKAGGAPPPQKAAAGPSGTGAVWIPAPRIEYFANGEAAVVSVEMRRGDGWRYRQKGLYVWRAGAWERRGDVETEGLGREGKDKNHPSFRLCAPRALVIPQSPVWPCPARSTRSRSPVRG